MRRRPGAAAPLRDGGIAIYSVPFIWHVHEAPREFYRFSLDRVHRVEDRTWAYVAVARRAAEPVAG